MHAAAKVAQAEALVQSAPHVGSKALVDRGALLDLLDEARRLAVTPDSAPARLSPTEEAARLLREAGDHADRSLAELEAVLLRVLTQIQRARARLVQEGGTLTSGGLHSALTDD